jgi:hypothetical protein
VGTGTGTGDGGLSWERYSPQLSEDEIDQTLEEMKSFPTMAQSSPGNGIEESLCRMKGKEDTRQDETR